LRECLQAVRREHVLVVQQVLDPCEDIVNVSWGRKLDLFTIRVYPCVIKAVTSSHRRARTEGAEFCQDSIKQVQVRVEVENVDRHPFIYIHPLGKHDDSLEVSFDKGCSYEWLTEIERRRTLPSILGLGIASRR